MSCCPGAGKQTRIGIITTTTYKAYIDRWWLSAHVIIIIQQMSPTLSLSLSIKLINDYLTNKRLTLPMRKRSLAVLWLSIQPENVCNRYLFRSRIRVLIAYIVPSKQTFFVHSSSLRVCMPFTCLTRSRPLVLSWRRR